MKFRTFRRKVYLKRNVTLGFKWFKNARWSKLFLQYDQFEVEEIPDHENKADSVIFEENVKVEKIIVASGKKGRKKEKVINSKLN